MNLVTLRDVGVAYDGYEALQHVDLEIAKKAMKTGESIRNLILREGLLSEKEMETVLDPVDRKSVV